jgi:hypothetical protein
MPLVDDIGGKTAGLLVKSADWNTLVAAVDALDAKLTQSVDDLSDTIEALDARVTAIGDDLETLSAQVTPLLKRALFVTLQTSKANFAIGELATITVAVTDAAGQAVTTQPWIDLVSSWGQLRLVSPTTGLPGVGGRTLSVQTNAQGVATVQLRADHVEDLDDDDEAAVDLALQNVVAETNQSAVATIMAAATPNDANAKLAYQTISQQYTVSAGMRNYVDTYYLNDPVAVGGGAFKVKPIDFGHWVDYRATVIAVAKSDSDASTPDQAHGVASTQLTFRDWIGGWYLLDFVAEATLSPKIEEYQIELEPLFTGTPIETSPLVKDGIDELILREEGLLGRQRAYHTVRAALSTIDITQEERVAVAEPMTNALVIQQTLDNVAAAPIAADTRQVAFATFTDVAAQKEITTAAVAKIVTTQVAAQVGAAKSELETGLVTRQSQFEESLLAGDGEVVKLVADRFKDVQETVVKLGQIDPDQLVAVADLRGRVDSLQVAVQQFNR